jgi:hypothetical protein
MSDIQELVDQYEPSRLLDLLAEAFNRNHDERAAEAAKKAARSVDPEYQKIPF